MATVFSPLYSFLLYTGYLVFLLVIALSVKYSSKTSKRAIDDFFAYTKKGHKRVAKLGDILLYFFITQLQLHLLVALPVRFSKQPVV